MSDFEDIALGVSEVAPVLPFRAALNVSELGDVTRRHLSRGGVDIPHRESDLIPHLIVMGPLRVKCQQLQEPTLAHVEPDPIVAGSKFAQPEDVAEKRRCASTSRERTPIQFGQPSSSSVITIISNRMSTAAIAVHVAHVAGPLSATSTMWKPSGSAKVTPCRCHHGFAGSTGSLPMRARIASTASALPR